MLLPRATASLVIAFGSVLAFSNPARSQTLLKTAAGEMFSQFGRVVTAAGDVDGDGVRDVLVGGHGIAAAWVRSGVSLQAIWKVSADPYLDKEFGDSILGDIDLDADGTADFVVACPLEDGFIRIYQGRSGMLLAQLTSPLPGERFGYSMCRGADIDNDGVPEIVIGSPIWPAKSNKSGHIYYYSLAKKMILRIVLDVTGTHVGFGTLVADAGDVDRDGKTDLVATTKWGAKNQLGAVQIISGATGQLLKTWLGPTQAEAFASSVVAIGPLDPGANSLLAIGAPNEGKQSGAVYLYDAMTGVQVDHIAGNEGSRLGYSLSMSEHPGENGPHTLFAGAPGSEENGGASAVHVYDLPTRTLLHVIAGSSSTKIGISVAAIGDSTGDGKSEFVIGQPTGGFTSGLIHLYDGITPCGTSKNLGGGCIGGFGITPKLSLDGCLRASWPSTVGISIESGPHVPTPAFLFLGAMAGSLKLNSMCSLQFAQIFGSPFMLPLTPNGAPFPQSIASGAFSAAAMVPATGFAYSFRAQAVVLDTLAPTGLSTTNAVELTFLP